MSTGTNANELWNHQLCLQRNLSLIYPTCLTPVNRLVFRVVSNNLQVQHSSPITACEFTRIGISENQPVVIMLCCVLWANTRIVIVEVLLSGSNNLHLSHEHQSFCPQNPANIINLMSWNISLIYTCKTKTLHCLQTASMRYSLFTDVTQRWLTVNYRRFGTIYRSHLQGSSSPRWDWCVVPKRY